MDRRVTRGEPQTEAQVRFAAVLQTMFSNFDLMVRDPEGHAGYLGELAGDTEISGEVQAVAEFALRYHAIGRKKGREKGREEAIALVPKDNTVPIGVPIGVPVKVAIPHSVVEKEKPGLLVGLMDAKYVDGQRVIEGVAAIKNSEDRWAFVNVVIQAVGDTVLLSEDQREDNPDTWILMRYFKSGRGR